MENKFEVPKGYKLVKIGITEAQKRALQKYREKNKEIINERNKIRNKERYNNNEEYRIKTQNRMRETMKKKKEHLQNPE